MTISGINRCNLHVDTKSINFANIFICTQYPIQFLTLNWNFQWVFGTKFAILRRGSRVVFVFVLFDTKFKFLRECKCSQFLTVWYSLYESSTEHLLL
jgi:hypothetical protein